MKMSEHFEQDLKACDITSGLGNTKFGLVDSYGIATGKLQMEAAVHAINQHDALVAMNAELVEALIEIDDYLSTDVETTIGNDSAIHRSIQCKLSKAKELSQ